MKGKVLGCLSVVAFVTVAFTIVGTVVVARGLRELNGLLDGDIF